ncbi:hypothetical protein GH733_002521 [Mirounga leonina]|nr:hypothetical protein GH733_002521 [Mirounga leonina]
MEGVDSRRERVIWLMESAQNRYVIRYKDRKGCERNLWPFNFLACGASEMAALVIANLDTVKLWLWPQSQLRISILKQNINIYFCLNQLPKESVLNNEGLGSHAAAEDISDCLLSCRHADGSSRDSCKKGMLGGQGAMVSHFTQLVHFFVMESAVTLQLKKSHMLTPGFLQRLQRSTWAGCVHHKDEQGSLPLSEAAKRES